MFSRNLNFELIFLMYVVVKKWFDVRVVNLYVMEYFDSMMEVDVFFCLIFSKYFGFFEINIEGC